MPNHPVSPHPEPHPEPRTVLAVDIGGTHLRVAHVAADGAILARRRIDTPTDRGPAAVVDAIVRELASLTPANDPRAVAIGIAAPGPLDPRTGIVHEVPNMPGWRGFPLGPQLSAATGLPAHVHNDANLAALAEARLGAGRGHDPVVYLTVSTGVGGGIVIDGRIFAGAAGLAGELGHTIVHAGGPACNLGHAGCLEALASGTAIARRAREAVRSGAPTRLADVAAAGLPVDAAAVARAADAGDPLARAIFHDAGSALGLAIGGFINIFDPGRIVLGGGVTAAWPLFEPAMQLGMRRVAMAWEWHPVDIVPAALGDDAGLVGAGLWAWERHAA